MNNNFSIARADRTTHLKVVVVSPNHFTISDVGARSRQSLDLSMESIRASVVESLAQ